MHLAVGLGNPGKEYENTRHNLGFKVVGEIGRRNSVSNFKSKCQSEIAQFELSEKKIIIARPQTFMNNSGLAVRGLLEWFKIKPEKMFLIYDDVDLELGQLRLREKGNAGGHKGVDSVIEHTGTNQFARVRIGIGRPNLEVDTADYVLQNIPPSERSVLEEAVSLAAEAVEFILSSGISAAMNKYNS